MSVQNKTHESNWEKKNLSFCKASATFIGRLSCLDMQVEQWMKKARGGFHDLFFCDTKHYREHYPPPPPPRIAAVIQSLMWEEKKNQLLL